MKTCLRLALVMGIGLGGLGSTAASASAMPLSGLDPELATAADTTKAVENIRWICGPYGGCQWVPGWRRYGGGGHAMAIGVHGAGVLMREGLMAITLIGEARLDLLRKARASF